MRDEPGGNVALLAAILVALWLVLFWDMIAGAA